MNTVERVSWPAGGRVGGWIAVYCPLRKYQCRMEGYLRGLLNGGALRASSARTLYSTTNRAPKTTRVIELYSVAKNTSEGSSNWQNFGICYMSV